LAVVGPGAVSTHVAARALPDLGLSLDAALLWPLPLWLGALAALAALALRGGRDDTTRTALGLWLAVAVIAVAAHGPRWWHHGLLIAVPAAGVLALAVVRGGAARVVAVMALGAASVSVGLRPLAAPLDVVCAEEAARRLAALPAGVVVTDRPMVALRAGHVAPPGLAVVSLKRVALREVDDAALARYVVAAGGALRGVWLERFIGDAGLDATPRVAAALRGRQATVWRCPTGPGVLATLPPEP
jgi:hypothetical protein